MGGMIFNTWCTGDCPRHDSIMSDDCGRPASRGHVFNGGSQQPRARSNLLRTEDYTGLHARRDRLFGRHVARQRQRQQAWAAVCRDICFLRGLLVECVEGMPWVEGEWGAAMETNQEWGVVAA